MKTELQIAQHLEKLLNSKKNMEQAISKDVFNSSFLNALTITVNEIELLKWILQCNECDKYPCTCLDTF